MAKTPKDPQEARPASKEGGASSKIETALRKKRSQRSFPASTFEEPLDFAAAVFRIGSGQPVKRLTLFDQLGKSPESGGSRQLITNSGRYGLTRGGMQAENIELTPEGQKSVDEQITARERARTRLSWLSLALSPFKSCMRSLLGTSFRLMQS